MGLLERWANPEPVAADGQRTPGPGADFWYQPFNPGTASGIRVGVREAMRVPAVRRAVTVLAGSIASLPRHVYERTTDGREIATGNPLDQVISFRPNDEMSGYSYWERVAAELILHHHHYSRIIPGRLGAVDQLIPLAPEDVRRVRLSNGKIAYDWRQQDGTTKRLVSSEVFHVSGLQIGNVDESLLEQGADTIANAISLSRYSGKQWRNGARLSGVLETDKTLSAEAVGRLSDSWHAQYGGVENAGKTAVLEEGLKFKELSQNNTDAQLFEQWNFSVEEIGRLFGVPAVLLGHADKTSTYASAEQFFLSFVNYSLRPWLKNIEDAINSQLIIAPRLYYAKFSVQGLLRGDHKARSEFYRSGITAGWLTPNEARELEDLNRKEGGDSLYRPLNVEPADAPYRQQENNQ